RRIRYDSVNQPVLQQVPKDSKAILDVGCGCGLMGQILKNVCGRSVVGVTLNEEEAQIARTRLNSVDVQDLNAFNPAGLEKFDCIICCHVLEHLYRPEDLLIKLRDCLQPGGVLVLA